MTKIVWTEFAVESLKEIFEFYKSKASIRVANKIRTQILQSSKQLSDNPEMGRIEPFLEKLQRNHRFLLSGKYKIIYRVEEDAVVINDVFDVRRNPEKMIYRKKE